MRRLLIFMKYPTPGRVKTRLAASLGNDAASAISRACTELTLSRLALFHREGVLWVDPPAAIDQARGWLGSAWPLAPQEGKTLGERLIHACAQAFAEGASRVVAIGSDSPWLQARDLEAAFAALDDADLVVGPAEDGGYYLIGLSRPVLEVFDGIAWSTPSVCEETMAKARGLGLRVHTLAPGYDIDRLDDVRRFLDEETRRGGHAEPVAAIERWSRRTQACPS